MIKAYIYGTPKGFDAYGSDKSFEGYLKGFYITSRRGKRLMVNRRANGETIYSYLHYGLMEYSDIGKDKAGRINSFFGMSLHISDGIYTPDLKRVFDWFDYWFNKILEDGTILKEASSGYIQYQVSKFANANNIDHLQSNLPNIFSEKSGTLMLDYDDSFIEGKPGQIAQLNSDENEDIVLSTFKNYQWVALSPNFKKIDKPTDEIRIELDFNDLNDKLAEYNKLLLPIAINPGPSSYEELCKISDLVQENYLSITSYLKAISNDKDSIEEYNKFSCLVSDYVAILDNITALKIKIQESKTPEPKKFCYNCQEYKDISQFSSPEVTTCIACEEKTAQSHKKQCNKCGKIKPCTDFEEGSKICKACERKNENTGFIIPSWVKIAAIPFTLLLVVGIVMLINKPTIPEKNDPASSSSQVETSQKVDKGRFNSFINEYNYQGAYDYLTDKSDKDEYLPFNNIVNTQVWNIINNGTEDLSNTLNILEGKVLTGITILDDEAINSDSKNGIIEIVEQFRSLADMLSLKDKQFGPNSKETASNIIMQGSYDNKWTNIVKSKYERYKNISTQTGISAPTQQGYGAIVHLDGDYNPLDDVKEIDIVPNKKIEAGIYKRNTFIDICYDRDKVRIRRTKVLEDNNNPTAQPQAKNYGLNATHRIRISNAGLNIHEVIYVEDLTGKVLTEITIKTKQ